MRWFAYFILAYVAVALQIGLSPFVQYRGAAPNLVLLAAVFIALNAPRDAALLGCFCLGVMQDLVTQQQLGLFALSYGLMGLVVFGLHQVVYREHPLTHFSMALVGGVITTCMLLVHGWIHPPSPAVPASPGQPALQAIRLSPATEFVRAGYTAVLAPFVLGVLQRVKKVFAFQPQRRKVRAW
jgi:rod shape-determining protein MreD